MFVAGYKIFAVYTFLQYFLLEFCVFQCSGMETILLPLCDYKWQLHLW